MDGQRNSLRKTCGRYLHSTTIISFFPFIDSRRFYTFLVLRPRFSLKHLCSTLQNNKLSILPLLPRLIFLLRENCACRLCQDACTILRMYLAYEDLRWLEQAMLRSCFLRIKAKRKPGTKVDEVLTWKGACRTERNRKAHNFFLKQEYVEIICSGILYSNLPLSWSC